MTVNDLVDTILDEELNKNTSNKLINYIDKDINFKYNSFNICIGKQSTGKTTSVLKELIKLSLKDIKSYGASTSDQTKFGYHLIIYVSNNSSDDTFNNLYKYINIPIVKTDYEHLDEQFLNLIKLKDEYNKMIDGEIPKNNKILPYLYINNFNNRRLHTFVLMDDAAFILKNDKSKWFKRLCQLRHLNTTVFLCIQVWKSINPSLKTQITSIHLFPGYSRQQLNYIYNQICVDMKFEEFYELYVSIPPKHKLIIDLVDMTTIID